LEQGLRRHGFAGRHVVTAVPDHATLASVLDLPAAKPGVPLAEIARAEMAHVTGCDAGEIEVAYWPLPQPARSGAGTPVMAAACRHRDADQLLDTLERHGFTVDGLDIRGWALARCFAAYSGAQGVFAAVNLGQDTATFVLMHGDVLIYQRTLDGCAWRALGESMGVDHGFSEDVVRYVLFELGLEIHRRGEAADGPAFGRAMPQIESHTEAIAQELNLSMQYASHEYPDAELRQLLLTGSGAAIPGLPARISQRLETVVDVVRLGDVVECPPPFAAQAQLTSMTVAAGLAQYSEEAIK
jgi:Tfp pilus assembly PilM family ATPase